MFFIDGFSLSWPQQPLSAKRLEHEKARKAIKEQWHREHRRLTEAFTALKKAKATYQLRNQVGEGLTTMDLNTNLNFLCYAVLI